MKDSLLCILTGLLPASLQFKGLATKYASAKYLFHATVFQKCQTFYLPVGLQNHVSATDHNNNNGICLRKDRELACTGK